MAEITVETVDAKIQAGEVLTPEEELYVMGIPPEDPTDEGMQDSITAEGDPKAEKTPEEIEQEEKAKQEAEEAEVTKKKEEEAAAEAKKKADEEAAKTSEANKTDEISKKEPGDTGKPEGTQTPEESAKEGLARIEKELSKPEGHEDLSNLKTPAERGLFYQFRQERRARQDLQRQLDTVRFQQIKMKQEERDAKKPAPGEFMTAEQVEEHTKEITARAEATSRRLQSQVWTMQAALVHEDVYAVLAAGDQQGIIDKNPNHQAIIRDAYERGENCALVTYDLLMSDPNFQKPQKAEPVAKEEKKPEEKKPEEKTPEHKPSPDALKDQEKLSKNADKAVTTGNVGGGVEVPETITIEWVASLTEDQFRSLPEATRKKALELYG